MYLHDLRFTLLIFLLIIIYTINSTELQSTDHDDVIDITSQLQPQQLSSDTAATARRLRGMTQHNVGVGTVNGAPILVVEDINPELDQHEIHDYGHIHKSAHIHHNADGSEFLHVVTDTHEHLHQLQQQHQPSILNQLQQQHSQQIINNVLQNEKDIIRHGTHTHTADDLQQHAVYIVLLLLAIFIVSQILIYYWKQNHILSYSICAIGGTWILPLLYTIYHHLHNHHFIFIWLIFTLLSAYCLYITKINRTVYKNTPRIVYGSTYVIFYLCYTMTVVSLVSIILDLCGITLFVTYYTPFDIFPLFQYTIYLLIYGLYFGVLNRDMAELVTQRLASNIGYTTNKSDELFNSKQVPYNLCALCDWSLYNSIESTVTLQCTHTFHSMCLKGHTLIGKRDTCPQCHEKIELNQFVDTPWKHTTIWYSTLLNIVRYIIVFNPIIFIIANWILLIVY